MTYLSIIVIFILFQIYRQQQIIGCVEKCQNCRNIQSCSACASKYELSVQAKCIPQSYYPNCEFFSGRDACISCKPMFRFNRKQRRCEKMDDGCLIVNQNNQCIKCIYGGILNYGKCNTTFMNCKIIINNTCSFCIPGYILLNGKCINSDTNCKTVSNQSGLCQQCLYSYILVGYQCLSLKQSTSNNCLLALDNQTCSYCRKGYVILSGNCVTNQALQLFYNLYKSDTFIFPKCFQNQYLNPRFKACIKKPKNCQIFDFGFYRCTHCDTNYTLFRHLNYQCRDQSYIFCVSWNTDQCLGCQENYYLNDKYQCIKNPPFCQQVHGQICVKCKNNFILNSRYQCQDPNCQFSQFETGKCMKCKQSYNQNNRQNICKLYDMNCLEPQDGMDSKCKKCKVNYRYDEGKKSCIFVDPNCKFQSKKFSCQECKSGYYYNIYTKSCVLYPEKCKRANQKGDCQLCEKDFFVFSGKCKPFSRIPNCEVISQKSSSQCQKCNQRFYLDQKYRCQKLPILCIEVDKTRSTKNYCKLCQSNANLKNGLCYDSNCLYFDQNAECLGCKQGYQLDEDVSCIQQIPVKNCKQYSNGQCKVCADRYYFNNKLQCVLVQGKCNKYDLNTGQCLTCYRGYVVQDGVCVLQNQVIECDQYEDLTNTTCKKCHRNYQLNQTTRRCQFNQFGCIQKQEDGLCKKCKNNYVLDRNKKNCLKINSKIYNNQTKNAQIDSKSENDEKKNKLYIDQNCNTYNANRTSCIKCAIRKYFNKQKNKCEQIDPNCKEYNEDTGQCKVCYYGYVLGSNKMKCQLEKTPDDNCKTFFPNSQKCKQCYSGYYYEEKQKKCIQYDKLCQLFDYVIGQCKNCYSGYVLKLGKCVLQTESKSYEFDQKPKKQNSPSNNQNFIANSSNKSFKNESKL